MSLINSVKRAQGEKYKHKFQLSTTRSMKIYQMLRDLRKRTYLDNKSTPGSPTKKAVTQQYRAKLIKSTPEYSEFFDWIRDIRNKLGASKKDFSTMLGISYKTLYFYENKLGVIPGIETVKKLFELEKLCRAEVEVKKDKNVYSKNKVIIQAEIR